MVGLGYEIAQQAPRSHDAASIKIRSDVPVNSTRDLNEVKGVQPTICDLADDPSHGSRRVVPDAEPDSSQSQQAV
jgi:hypothetical protein